MGQLRVAADGAVPAQRFIDALTDFGPDRAHWWSNLSEGPFAVHEVGATWAEVTEGGGAGIWQRSRYDWSTPGRVTLEVLDSNAFGPGSRWTYDVSESPSGCHVELSIIRKPNSLKGRLFDALLQVIGPAYFRRDLRKTLAKLQARG